MQCCLSFQLVSSDGFFGCGWWLERTTPCTGLGTTAVKPWVGQAGVDVRPSPGGYPHKGLVAPAEQRLFHQKLLIMDLHYHGFWEDNPMSGKSPEAFTHLPTIWLHRTGSCAERDSGRLRGSAWSDGGYGGERLQDCVGWWGLYLGCSLGP